MAEINTKIIYDDDEDILSLSRGREVKASIDIGDFIIDVDHKGFITGVEVLNASQNLDIGQEKLQQAKTNQKINISYFYIVCLCTKKS